MGYNIGYTNESDSSIINPPIEQGSTFELDFTITLPDSVMVHFLEGRVIEGVLDAGTTLRAQYRNPITNSTAVDFAGTITKTSANTLACHLELDSEKTAAIVASTKGYWDCEIVNDDTIPYVFKPFGAGNKAKVAGEVTRDA